MLGCGRWTFSLQIPGAYGYVGDEVTDGTLLCGKRGSGKSLGAVDKAGSYLKAGRAVATNINLNIEYLVPAFNKTRWYRVPDWPSAQDLAALPLGNRFLEWKEGEADPVMLPGYDEKYNGLLLLDEVATFLNAREWNGNGRQEFISWLAQSRKYGWDLLLIAQSVGMVDKQVRDSFIDVQGTVRNMEKMAVPVLSPIVKYFTGQPLHFPKMHFVALKYGFHPDAAISDRWFWRGSELYKAYNTLQRISGITGQQGTSIGLSAWEMKGRHMNKWDLRRQMAAGGLVLGLLIAFPSGYWAAVKKGSMEKPLEVVQVDDGVKVRGVITSDVTRLVLTNGQTVIADAMKADLSGSQYKSGGRWYAEVK